MDEKTANKELIKRYPFLHPWNRWVGKVVADYDYVTTELDAMPDGWRIAFGEDICKEIMEELVSNNCLDTYRITQIKEKYGQLCWYALGGSERIYREIVPKYEEMSRRICIQCGQPAALVSMGWISPWCKTCAEDVRCGHFIDIDEFYSSDEEET